MSPSIINLRQSSWVLFYPGTSNSWTSRGWGRARTGSATLTKRRRKETIRVLPTCRKFVILYSLPIITFIKQILVTQKALQDPIIFQNHYYEHQLLLYCRGADREEQQSWTCLNYILEVVFFFFFTKYPWYEYIYSPLVCLSTFFIFQLLGLWAMRTSSFPLFLWECIIYPAPHHTTQTNYSLNVASQNQTSGPSKHWKSRSQHFHL